MTKITATNNNIKSNNMTREEELKETEDNVALETIKLLNEKIK